MNWWVYTLDIALLVFLLVEAVRSYKKGLLLTLYRIISFFLAIWIAWMINAPIKTALKEHTGMYDWMKTNISEGIVNSIDNSLLTKDDVSSESSVEDINAPGFIQKLVFDAAKEDTSNKLGEVITEKVTDICMTIVTFVIVILVVMIIMSLLQGLLKILSDIPLVDIVNKLAGGFFGILWGSIKIWLVLVILGLIFSETVHDWVSGTILTNWYYENNLITYIIVKLLG